MALLPTPHDPRKAGEWIPAHRAADNCNLHYDQLKKMIDDGKIDHIVNGFVCIHKDDVKRLCDENELQLRLTEKARDLSPPLCFDQSFRDLVLVWRDLTPDVKLKISKLLPPVSVS